MSAGSSIRKLVASLSAATLLAAATIAPAHACTGIRLTAQDGSVIYARTLEFATDIRSDVIVVPRGFARTGTTPNGAPGLAWKAKYASVGANALGLPLLVDGLNEAGLGAGLFYFQDYAGYMPYTPADAAKTIAPWELASWILDNFASVAEVRAAIGGIVVSAAVLKHWGVTPPLHVAVHDATGQSIVIQYVGGKLNVHDNPLGVVTNSPTFDWHMTNLRNYVNLSVMNAPAINLGAVRIAPTGQGAGLLGLPGDFTPPSRFVRAVAFSQAALPSKTGRDGVLSAFRILNSFDIPKGAARERDERGNVTIDYTLWTSASDLKARRFHFRTHENSQIRMVDLKTMRLDAREVATFSMKGDEVIRQINP